MREGIGGTLLADPIEYIDFSLTCGSNSGSPVPGLIQSSATPRCLFLLPLIIFHLFENLSQSNICSWSKTFKSTLFLGILTNSAVNSLLRTPDLSARCSMSAPCPAPPAKSQRLAQRLRSARAHAHSPQSWSHLALGAPIWSLECKTPTLARCEQMKLDEPRREKKKS